MKQKTGFELNTICGTHILVATGEENIDFSNIVSFNESSAYLWEHLKDREFTVEDMAELLTQEYDVSKEQAIEDCKALAQAWKDAGIVE